MKANWLVFLLFCEVLSSLKSGIYLDNGFDQTAIANLEESEVEILNLLGLPNRPKKLNNSLTKSTSKYILNVYNSLFEKKEGHTRSKRSFDVNDENSAIEESDVIMTFETIDYEEYSIRRERGKRLRFNITELSFAENVVKAELKIFQKGILKRAEQFYTVVIYELIDKEKKFQYISSINTTGSYQGWLNFNLTSSIDNWTGNLYNKCIYLSVYSTTKPGFEIRPKDIGLFTMKQTDESRPFIVAFIKSTNHIYPQRTIRAVASKYGDKKSDYASIMKEYHHYGAWRTCRVHTLYISFKDLQWQDWVIAPEGYAAYYCAGECNFPLTAHMNATKHALIQSLVHLIQPHRYPKPCCAPTELSPIPLVYYLDAGSSNVVLKKYSNMAVKSCGCH